MLRACDFVVTVLLALALVPVFRMVGLPLHFNWRDLVGFWFWIASRSLVLALAAYVLQFPGKFWGALTRRGPDIGFPWKQIASVLLPAGYLFVVFFLVLSYNDAIAAVRFNGTGDSLLSEVDSWLLAGHSVSGIARFAVAYLPGWSIRASELIYVGMFFQVGAANLLVGLSSGLQQSLRLVSAIALSYYLALVCFLLITATGPYYTPDGQTAFLNTNHPILTLQQNCIERLNVFRAQARPEHIGADYWIALPCMHLVQPLLVLWFLRRWGRVFYCLLVYDLLLVAAILVLEQHYVIDLVAAFPVALVAIVLVDRPVTGFANTAEKSAT